MGACPIGSGAKWENATWDCAEAGAGLRLSGSGTAPERERRCGGAQAAALGHDAAVVAEERSLCAFATAAAPASTRMLARDRARWSACGSAARLRCAYGGGARAGARACGCSGRPTCSSRRSARRCACVRVCVRAHVNTARVARARVGSAATGVRTAWGRPGARLGLPAAGRGGRDGLPIQERRAQRLPPGRSPPRRDSLRC